MRDHTVYPNERVSAVIRVLTRQDEGILWHYLYLALFLPEGRPAFPPEVVREPSLARYVAGWGREGDLGVLASDFGLDVGAAWLRLWSEGDRGYGFVAPDIPELSMAVRPAYRGRGIGTLMLHSILAAASGRHASVSLSVSRANPARRLYLRCGFEVVEECKDSLTMVRASGIEADSTAGARACLGRTGP